MNEISMRMNGKIRKSNYWQFEFLGEAKASLILMIQKETIFQSS